MKKQEVLDKIQESLEQWKCKKKIITDCDKRIADYIEKNLKKPEEHNMYEILAVMRFIRFLHKYTFKSVEVKKFIRFYEMLKFKSDKGMVSFPATESQCFIFANIYGLYRDDTHRLTRNALLMIARKYGKSQLTSAIGLYDFLFGAPDAQVAIGSNSFAQSQIVFGMCKATLKCLDPTFTNFRLNREQIYCRLQGRDSKIMCLSSNADKLDGLNISTVVMDEYAQSDTAALKNVLESSQGVRQNPLSVVITTASSKLDTPFVVMLNSYKKILEGDIENDNIFALIFQIDEDDAEDSPVAWRKAQPHLGITVNEDFYRNEYQKALLNAEDMLEFRTKLLNIFQVANTEKWLDEKVVERNRMDLDLDKLKNRPEAILAVDLSVKDDMSCICVGMYSSLNKLFYFKNFYFIPKKTIEEHPNKEFYQNMLQQGDLIPCGDDILDYTELANFILSLGKKVKILEVEYDAYKSVEMINILKANKVKCAPYKQTFSNFTSPVESLEIGLYNDKIKLDDNPLIAWNIRNACIMEDRMGNKKPLKISEDRKIDGIICILMSLGRFQTYKRKC